MNPLAAVAIGVVGAISRVAFTEVALKRERKLQLLKEQQQILVTHFKPTSVYEFAVEDNPSAVVAEFTKESWTQVLHAIKQLEDLNHAS